MCDFTILLNISLVLPIEILSFQTKEFYFLFFLEDFFGRIIFELLNLMFPLGCYFEVFLFLESDLPS